MSTYTRTTRSRFPFDLEGALRDLIGRVRLPRTSLFALIMIGALVAFESFNYGTTEFALTDLLGDLRFSSLRWSTILALAFCGMDFAGIARLLSPHGDDGKTMETWYLLGAWLLAATMNAVLTWWAVSLALLSHNGLGNEIMGREDLLSSVPLFVAMLVWLIRVLMIGTFTLSSGQFTARNLFANNTRKPERSNAAAQSSIPNHSPSGQKARRSVRPAPKSGSIPSAAAHNTSMAARSARNHR